MRRGVESSCEPGMNPGINELKIKRRELWEEKKMHNYIRQTTSEDESALKPVPDSQTGEREFSCSRGPRSDRDAGKCNLQ